MKDHWQRVVAWMGLSLCLAHGVGRAADRTGAAAPDEPARESTGLWGSLKKAGSDIATGVKQGVDQSTDGQGVGGKVASDVNDSLAGRTPQVVGYVNLGNGQFMTYFDTSKMGFPSRGAPLTAPPKAGTVPPPTMVAPIGKFEGTMIPNNIDEAKKAGVFQPSASVAGGASGTANDRGGSDPPTVAVQEATDSRGNTVRNAPNNCRIIVEYDASGREIGRHYLKTNLDFSMASVCETKTFDMQRQGIRDARGSAPAKAQGWSGPGGATNAAIQDAQGVNEKIFAAEEARRQSAGVGTRATASASASMPASPPVATGGLLSDDDLAEQAATVCHLKAVQAFKLKEQSLQFVRYDRSADRVVMSEMLGGTRKEVVLDDKAFGQKSAALSRDIGVGGETCGRAFWGNEAIKAATAAFGG